MAKKSGKKDGAKSAAKLLAQWGKTEAKTGGQLPDGIYECAIKEADASVKDDLLSAHWKMEVQEGRYEGRTQHKRDYLSTDQNLEYFKGAMQLLDVELPDEESLTVKELDALMKECAGLAVEISVKTRQTEKGEFTNVYFQQLLEGGSGSSKEDEGEDEDEDEKKSKDEDEDADGDGDDDDEEESKPSIKKGSTVKFKHKDKTVKGKVKSEDSEEDEATVKITKTGKRVTVDLDDLKLVEDDDD